LNIAVILSFFIKVVGKYPTVLQVSKEKSILKGNLSFVTKAEISRHKYGAKIRYFACVFLFLSTIIISLSTKSLKVCLTNKLLNNIK